MDLPDRAKLPGANEPGPGQATQVVGMIAASLRCLRNGQPLFHVDYSIRLPAERHRPVLFDCQGQFQASLIQLLT